MSHRTQLLSLRLLVLLMAVAVVFLLLSGRVEASTPGTEPVRYLVRPGDTLWAIAQSQAATDGDVRDTVAAIKELNGLVRSDLAIGQVLLLPGV